MSKDKKELSPIEQLKADLQNFMARRDHTQANLQQLIGAVFATEQAIEKLKKYEEQKNIQSMDDGEQ